MTPVTLARHVAAAVDGREAEVVIEACYGLYWAVDLLQADGYRVHLAHPAGNDWGRRRVKNDERDARDLADLCRLGPSPRRGSHLLMFGSYESSSAAGPVSSRCAAA